MYDNRVYIIISVVEFPLINFNETLIDSYSTIRLSVNGTKGLLVWDNSSTPSFYNNLNTIEGPYTYNQIYDIMLTPEWYQESV
jgi:hypothetical protein